MQKGRNIRGPCGSGNIANPKVQVCWSLSLLAELRLKLDLKKIAETEQGYTSGDTRHKKELPGQIDSDAIECDRLKEHIASVIDSQIQLVIAKVY